MPFWALIGLLFYRALTSGSASDWMLLGLCSALLMYTKYSGVMLLLPLLAFLVIEPTARRRLRTPGPYLALLIGIGLYLPHLSWLRDNGFLPFAYALDRAADAQSWFDHILFPLRFAGAQVVDHLGLFLLLLLGRGFRATEPGLPMARAIDSLSKRYVVTLALGPLLLTLIVSALFGYKLRSMWGAPMFCFSGLLAVIALRPVLEIRRLKLVFATWCALFILVPVAYAAAMIVGPHITDHARRGHYPGSATAQALTRAWRETTGQPLRFVIGTTWTAGNLAFYSADRPAVFIDANPKASPWIDQEQLIERGGLIVWRADRRGDKLPNDFATKFPSALVRPPMNFAWQTSADIAPLRLGWAIVPPHRSKSR
jgi:4-amino-4-deoxy-L-arabinose transferase-like glycosyltransferase